MSSDLPPCTAPACFALGPHSHRMLEGEFRYGPNVRAQEREADRAAAAGGGGPVRAEFSGAAIPLVCSCGKRWTGPAFTPLRPGERERMRTCDTCLTKAEDAALARTPAPPFKAPLRAPREVGVRELNGSDR